MANKVYLIFGYSFLLIGSIFILNSLQGITGFAVFNNASIKLGFYAGLWFVVGGLVILTAEKHIKSKDLETKIKVYDSSHGKDKNPDRAYRITDSAHCFRNKGENPEISLYEFKREVAKISNDEELMGIIRESFVPGLSVIANSSEPSRRKIAEQFLDVLGVEISNEETSDRDYHISKSEKERIKAAFKSWDGGINGVQRDILKKYDLNAHVAGSGHYHISDSQTGEYITASGSPSDHYAGYQVAGDIIRLLEKRKKHN